MAPTEKHQSFESDTDLPPTKKQRETENFVSAASPAPSQPRNPVFEDLAAKYPTAEKLEEHLKSLSRPALEALIMSGAFPNASSELRHCVYCHKTYHASNNDLGSCSVKHFRNYVDLDEDEMEWQCCGNRWSDADCDDWMESGESMFPDCFVGRHRSEEITTDDEADVEEENRAEFMFVDSTPQSDNRPVWWREWRTHGKTCKKIGCKEISEA